MDSVREIRRKEARDYSRRYNRDKSKYFINDKSSIEGNQPPAEIFHRINTKTLSKTFINLLRQYWSWIEKNDSPTYYWDKFYFRMEFGLCSVFINHFSIFFLLLPFSTVHTYVIRDIQLTLLGSRDDKIHLRSVVWPIVTFMIVTNRRSAPF